MCDAARADTATQQLSTCHTIPRATLSSVTGQTETPFLLLPLHFVASSLGPISPCWTLEHRTILFHQN